MSYSSNIYQVYLLRCLLSPSLVNPILSMDKKTEKKTYEGGGLCPGVLFGLPRVRGVEIVMTK